MALPTVNAYRDKAKHPSPLTHADLIPRRKLLPPNASGPQKTAEPLRNVPRMLQIVEALTLSRGGADRRRQKPDYGRREP